MLEKIGTGEKGYWNIYKIIQQKSENVLVQTTEKWDNMLNEGVHRNKVLRGFQILHRTTKYYKIY